MDKTEPPIKNGRFSLSKKSSEKAGLFLMKCGKIGEKGAE